MRLPHLRFTGILPVPLKHCGPTVHDTAVLPAPHPLTTLAMISKRLLVIILAILAIGTTVLIAAQSTPAQRQSTAPRPTASSPSAVAQPAPAGLGATPSIGTPVVTPPVIPVTVPTLVTVTATITDPSLIPNSVNLLRLGATGTQPTILGAMHDDGVNGDAVARDRVYSINFTASEFAPGQVQLQISAAFTGRLSRIFSATARLPIWQQFSSPRASLFFAYPEFPGVPAPTITATSDGDIQFEIATRSSGMLLPVFGITITATDGTQGLQDWFATHVDDSSHSLATHNTYLLVSMQDGRTALLLNSAAPVEWNGGPLTQAYIMSEDGRSVAAVQLSQDDPLSEYGYSTQHIAAIVDTVAHTITFR